MVNQASTSSLDAVPGPVSSDESAAHVTATPIAAKPNDGSAYCLGALVALGIGLFIFGFPCGLLAFGLSKKAIEHGATGFGTVLKWVSVVYIILLIVGLFASAR